MARKKKQAKSKRARAKAIRQDYRKGGRVGLAHGAKPKRSDYGYDDEGAKWDYKADLEEWEAAKKAHEDADSAEAAAQDGAG